MYLDLAKELKRNTRIMEGTFSKFNLKVLQISYHPYSDDDADCELIVEIESINGESMDDDAVIKINLYDKDGEILMTEDYYIDGEEFAGYDTYKISLYNNSRTLLEAKSARLYMSQG